MPVTAKFSEKFYQRLGHELVDELIDWCNQVDATYRSDFRELIDTRFEKMEAKVEQRLAEFRTEMSGFRVEFRTELARMETRLTLRMFLFWVGSVGMFFLQRL